MKRLAALLALALVLSGCATTGSQVNLGLINSILDSTLPPSFMGPAKIRHRNPYITLDIEADGLKRGATGWGWRWLTYKREGRLSEGTVTLGTK